LLGDVLFPPADERRTTLSIMSWWESRRLMFNGIVGGTGVFTLVVISLIALIPPSVKMPALDWRPVVVYGGLANVCYTFGWAIEAAAQRVWGDRCPRFGPALFRQGLAFSVGLTLLPILLMSFTWVARVFLSIFA
jgi:hypothetical protein